MNKKKRRKFHYAVGEKIFSEDLATVPEPNPEKDKKAGIFMLVAVALALALIISTAAVQLAKKEKTLTEPAAQMAQYRSELEAAQKTNTALTEENQKLNREFNETRSLYFASLNSISPANQQILDDYQTATVMAGMTDYDGPGVRVVIQDKAGIRYDQTTTASEIVHDADIRYVVDWFKRNYVSAIAVNNERLSPMSPLLCTGPSVLVNRVYQSNPFVVEAGCDAEQILSLLEASNGINQMRSRGLRIEIEAIPDMHIAAQQDQVYVNEQVRKLGG